MHAHETRWEELLADVTPPLPLLGWRSSYVMSIPPRLDIWVLLAAPCASKKRHVCRTFYALFKHTFVLVIFVLSILCKLLIIRLLYSFLTT